MVCSKLSFYFDKNDPNFISTQIVVQRSPYIGHWFITAPIYNNEGRAIGYKATDDYVQEVTEEVYLVRYANTYFFDEGTISWEYASTSSAPDPYYKPNVVAKARITSGTGDFLKTIGNVSLTPLADGKRNVVVTYNKN